MAATRSVLTLRGSLTIAHSEEIHRKVLDALNVEGGLVLDCSETTEVDLSFLQILFAAQRAGARAKTQIDFATPPRGALADALRRCGFTPAAESTSLAEIFPN